MTRSVGQSLLELQQESLEVNLAKKFTLEYLKDPRRGYGNTVVDIFHQWSQTEFEGDVLEPATRQFNGKGSLGNGAAMRSSPISLFYSNSNDNDNHSELIQMTKRCSLLTHTNPIGINGAILFALAIRKSLDHGINQLKEPKEEEKIKLMNQKEIEEFLDFLIEQMSRIEQESNCPVLEPIPTSTDVQKKPDSLKKGSKFFEPKSKKPFTDQLVLIKNSIIRSSNLKKDQVVEMFGNNVSALGSVPTSIYCVLRAHSKIDPLFMDQQEEEEISLIQKDIFLCSIFNAISIGGDTDTIASMAGSMIGALYGHSIIQDNKILIQRSEGSKEMIELASKLYQHINKDTK